MGYGLVFVYTENGKESWICVHYPDFMFYLKN